MALPSQEKWIELARNRLASVLRTHGVACARTLENKICDGGPGDMRVEPHILTQARKRLEEEGIIRAYGNNTKWYHLAETRMEDVQDRYSVQLPVYDEINSENRINERIGQCLEISVLKSLSNQSNMIFFGGFSDLDEHDDSSPYSQIEPPKSMNGKLLPDGKSLDFLAVHSQVGAVGIEVKNKREWLYPNRIEIIDLLEKCLILDCVPVLVARRFPFITPRVLIACGMVVHQTFNQLLPETDHALAKKAKDKDILGFHDIRTINDPDRRLHKSLDNFFGKSLPNALPEARNRFNANKKLIEKLVIDKSISPDEFIGTLVKSKKYARKALVSDILPSIVSNIKEITDGDTFDVHPPVEFNGKKFTRIRISDYDAPEKGQPGHGDAVRKFIAVFSDRQDTSRKVELDPKTVDEYGRLICDVWYKEKKLNDYLLK